MGSAKQNSIPVALILIAILLVLRLERPHEAGREFLNGRSEGRAREQATFTSPTPPARQTVDAENLARFKARIASLSKRPALGFSPETGDTPQAKALLSLRAQLELIETQLASQEDLVNQLALSLSVPQAFTVAEAKQIAIGTSQYGSYFSAIQGRKNMARMCELLKMQIAQEELAMQATFRAHRSRRTKGKH